MEQHSRGAQSRGAQLFAWIRGLFSQSQSTQSDRHMFDGVTRSLDDPDNRTRLDGLTRQLESLRHHQQAQQAQQRRQQHQHGRGW